MKHVLTIALGVDDALCGWMLSNAPGVFIIVLLVCIAWWGRGKIFEYQNKFDTMDHKVNLLDFRLTAVESRLDRVESRLDRIEVQLNEMNLKLTALTTALITSGKISM